MKIIFEEKSTEYHVAVAEICTTVEILYRPIQSHLSEMELLYYKGLKSEKRKSEWLGIRSLLLKMTGKYHEIRYTEQSQPYIENDFYISITHCKHIIGIILSSRIQTGIDLEIISPRILTISHKFISEEELVDFGESERLKKIYINWCGKETLYKIKQIGGFDFKTDFRITTDHIQTAGKTDAIISINDTIERFELCYRFIINKQDEILIVWY
jgi:phosphopantetheinyl transferase